MKFTFKIQPYQTDAVDAVVKVFDGQGYHDGVSYIRDIGRSGLPQQQLEMNIADTQVGISDLLDDTGFKNEDIELSDAELLNNIQSIQHQNNINVSSSLIKNFGRCSLDVEMETGTGKTYVYIKTMFELNKKYGWSKFIVVVPSIAIREGVKKSFEDTAEHFMEHYGKKALFFIYDSKYLTQIDSFSSSSGINVMIINTQAFNISFDENKNNPVTRIIYSERDEFGSRRPIDVIAANRPIVILDEPQKMGGNKTQKALKSFNPLFSINYSATHKDVHNPIYVLDALDAFNQKLVKKIEVNGTKITNLTGKDSYLYLEQIVLSDNHSPRARIELEVKHNSGIKREIHTFDVGDNLYITSKEMEQYRDYIISDINPNGEKGTVTFTNAKEIHAGDVFGDIPDKEKARIQIRKTIVSHFKKESELFDKGIKCLSLFFIDEVSKYRQYDVNGNEELGEYGKMFEEEYIDILNGYLTLERTDYQDYLREHCYDASRVHNGYFSIDKRTNRCVNNVKDGKEYKLNADGTSDDISAYDLILKDKERLLSFEEPTRFIFSHSALREGWDNPNIFQICTLKHSSSTTAKRQEVGRGLRLCVDKYGNRMDLESCGESIHKINMLTVIANESYESCVGDLQKETAAALYDRPREANVEYFKGKVIEANGASTKIDEKVANKIYMYLIKNDYLDYDKKITEKYRQDSKAGTVAELPEDLAPMAEGIHKLVQSVYDDSILKSMFANANRTKIRENPLNENFARKEFQALWNEINHKYAYTVEFDSDELIKKSIEHIDDKLYVAALRYTTTIGRQRSEINRYELERGESFTDVETTTQTVAFSESSNVKYDLIGKVAGGTKLTRKTVSKILQGIKPEKLYMFRNNPEEFISKVVKLINEQKATMIVDYVTYNVTEGKYDSAIFTAEKTTQDFEKAFIAKKAIQDYVFTDGYAVKSVERKFAEKLDEATEVCVYAKLPRAFHIPTPVGNYSPDWAIAFNEGTVKHIFFIAETKGTLESLQLKPIEQAKIKCARKLFNEMSTSKVVYHDVDSYESLLDIMNSI